jgi:ATP-dependent Clp protease ATP-binding subunit ClpB
VIKPEFLNRTDDLIMFTPLAEAEIAQLVRLQVEGVAKMLKNNGIDLQLTPKAIDLIASEGFDPQFGARPIKRALQRLLLNELSGKIIARSIDKEKPIVVDAEGEKLVFNNKG